MISPAPRSAGFFLRRAGASGGGGVDAMAGGGARRRRRRRARRGAATQPRECAFAPCRLGRGRGGFLSYTSVLTPVPSFMVIGLHPSIRAAHPLVLVLIFALLLFLSSLRIHSRPPSACAFLCSCLHARSLLQGVSRSIRLFCVSLVLPGSPRPLSFLVTICPLCSLPTLCSLSSRSFTACLLFRPI
eukprot:6185533-Pleurochrysis_carterae.AAC.5